MRPLLRPEEVDERQSSAAAFAETALIAILLVALVYAATNPAINSALFDRVETDRNVTAPERYLADTGVVRKDDPDITTSGTDSASRDTSTTGAGHSGPAAALAGSVSLRRTAVVNVPAAGEKDRVQQLQEQKKREMDATVGSICSNCGVKR